MSSTLLLLLLGVLVALPFPVLSIVAAHRAFVPHPAVPAWTAVLGAVGLGIGLWLLALTVVRDVSYGYQPQGQSARSPAAIWGAVWPLALPGAFMVALGLSTLLVVFSRLVRQSRTVSGAPLPSPLDPGPRT
ncbi:MAG: hypothetical protein ABI083_15080 [Lapillicoccus sp.]